VINGYKACEQGGKKNRSNRSVPISCASHAAHETRGRSRAPALAVPAPRGGRSPALGHGVLGTTHGCRSSGTTEKLSPGQGLRPSSECWQSSPAVQRSLSPRERVVQFTGSYVRREGAASKNVFQGKPPLLGKNRGRLSSVRNVTSPPGLLSARKAAQLNKVCAYADWNGLALL